MLWLIILLISFYHWIFIVSAMNEGNFTPNTWGLFLYKICIPLWLVFCGFMSIKTIIGF